MSEEADNPGQKQTEGNPYTLWFVIITFAAPVVAAYYMFFFGDITSFTNNGEFVRPYYSIERLEVSQDDQPFTGDSLGQRWHIMVATSRACDDDCRQKLVKLRQISKAVKRPVKMRYAIVQAEQPDAAFQSFIDEELDKVVLLQADATILDQAMPRDGATSIMYLSDPLGNMVMKFSDELTPKLVIKDLNRLF